MCQLDHLRQLKDQIYRIARSHNAEKVYVFGSCARMEERPGSDVDFIGDFKEHTSLFDLVGLEVDLSDLLGCPVDVVTLDRLETNDAFARSVKKEMVPL